MGIRSLSGAINKIAKAADKAHKANLRSRTAWDWLTETQKSFIKNGGLQGEFILMENNIHLNRRALDFAIIYQSQNTRMMNPVTRSQLKKFFKETGKKLE